MLENFYRLRKVRFANSAAHYKNRHSLYMKAVKYLAQNP